LKSTSSASITSRCDTLKLDAGRVHSGFFFRRSPDL
jgi:hypothetical protein